MFNKIKFIMKTDNVILTKSKAFALRVIGLYKYLRSEKREYVMSKQILRSGTSIGANVREGNHGQTKPDFITKMNIALKEADETCYWLELLYEGGFIDKSAYESIYADCDEIIKLLTSITKAQNG